MGAGAGKTGMGWVDKHLSSEDFSATVSLLCQGAVPVLSNPARPMALTEKQVSASGFPATIVEFHGTNSVFHASNPLFDASIPEIDISNPIFEGSISGFHASISGIDA